MNDVRARLLTALSDRYRIERELGQGGMATVYLAEDLKHDRKVALKVLKPELAAVLGAERFVVEIKTTASLQHPHILPLFDSGTADGFLFYVMPYIEGETLRGKLDRETQLGVDEAVRITSDVASALHYAHTHGVIHRDIKPENILLHDGRPMVADFGIALAVSAAAGGRMTETGLSLGTPHYMSPEQATAEKEITARSDIYSLGSVLYEMLTGSPPHTGASAQQIIMKIVTEEAAPVTRLRKSVPTNVAAAVAKAVERLPADRFASAKAFAEALANPAFTAASDAAVPLRRGVRRPRGAMALLGSVAAGASILAAWGWLRPVAALRSGSLTVTSILAPVGGAFGEQRALALSPDGRRLAFVFAAGDGSRMLWLRHLDRLDAEPIPRTAGSTAPFWSPDGRSLGFFAADYLNVLDPSGEVRRLCPASEPTGGSWSARGQILFGHRDGLSLVPDGGGGPCRLVVPRGAGPALRGNFLPDGQRFLYSRGLRSDMVAADLDGAEVATLPVRTFEFQVVAPGFLIVSSQTDPRAIEASEIDVRSLALKGPMVRLASEVRGQGGILTFTVSTSGALAFLPGALDRPYLEYDGAGLLRDTIRVEGTWSMSTRPRRAGPPMVALGGTTVGLWLYDLDADRATRLLARDSGAFAAGRGFGTTYPVFDGEGTRLVHASLGPTRCRIVERNLLTDVEQTLWEEQSEDSIRCPVPLDWSVDGRLQLWRRDTALEVVSIDGSSALRHLARPGRLWDGRFSPDGRTIAYASDETGRAEVYVQPLASGPPRRVSLDGGRWPTWTHAGRRLTFVTPDGRVQQVDPGAPPDSPGELPWTLFTIPTWRRSTFDDRGTGFGIVGEGERYIVRQSPAGVGVAYIQGWSALLQRADSTSQTGMRP